MNQETQWTILVYIADNGKLETLGQRTLDQIRGVGSTWQLKLAALYDRYISLPAASPLSRAMQQSKSH